MDLADTPTDVIARYKEKIQQADSHQSQHDCFVTFLNELSRIISNGSLSHDKMTEDLEGIFADPALFIPQGVIPHWLEYGDGINTTYGDYVTSAFIREYEKRHGAILNGLNEYVVAGLIFDYNETKMRTVQNQSFEDFLVTLSRPLTKHVKNNLVYLLNAGVFSLDAFVDKVETELFDYTGYPAELRSSRVSDNIRSLIELDSLDAKLTLIGGIDFTNLLDKEGFIPESSPLLVRTCYPERKTRPCHRSDKVVFQYIDQLIKEKTEWSDVGKSLRGITDYLHRRPAEHAVAIASLVFENVLDAEIDIASFSAVTHPPEYIERFQRIFRPFLLEVMTSHPDKEVITTYMKREMANIVDRNAIFRNQNGVRFKKDIIEAFDGMFNSLPTEYQFTPLQLSLQDKRGTMPELGREILSALEASFIKKESSPEKASTKNNSSVKPSFIL